MKKVIKNKIFESQDNISTCVSNMQYFNTHVLKLDLKNLQNGLNKK